MTSGRSFCGSSSRPSRCNTKIVSERV